MNVCLLVTHFVNEAILRKYRRIKASFDGDTVLLIHGEPSAGADLSDEIDFRIVTDKMLNELGYIRLCETLVPGSNHFLLFWFFLNAPAYEYYWNIEYDVDFSGRWEMFFQEIGRKVEADFISSHLMRYRDDPCWYWWNSLHTRVVLPLDKRLRSFNPVYRISRRALSYLDSFLKAGNRGHHEILIPTALYHSSFTLADFGGSGEFVPAAFREKFYWSDFRGYGIPGGTMRFRPAFDDRVRELVRDKLIHPLKPEKES